MKMSQADVEEGESDKGVPAPSAPCRIACSGGESTERGEEAQCGKDEDA
jgi:hypothetical protein